MNIHFVMRITSAWPKFVSLSENTLGNPGFDLQRRVFSHYGTVCLTVCAHPPDQLESLLLSHNFPPDDAVFKCTGPFEQVTADSAVFLFDFPAFLNDACVANVLDTLSDRPDRSFQLFTLEGRPLGVYAIHGSAIHEFQLKNAHSLLVPHIAPLTSRGELHAFRETVRHSILTRHIDHGVVIQAPESVVIDQSVTIAPDTFIGAGVSLQGNTTIGTGCIIKQGSLIKDCTIGDNCTVNASQLYQSTLESGVSVGPYAHIRPDCHLSGGVHIGSFVELKNAQIGKDSNVSHLSYMGDAQIGEHVNIGCGAITANFDGVQKHSTRIEHHAFVGCNAVLLAPVTVGESAVIAAGSAITEDVPACGLGIARNRQTNKAEWAANREQNW